MAFFRPYNRAQAEPAKPEPTPDGAANAAKPTKKEIPTPSRREAEAARRERANPTLSPKEMRTKERSAKNALRDEQLARSENIPARLLMRDLVDSHRGLAQWAMPILMITLAISLLVSSFSSDAAVLVTGFTYSIFVLIGLDLFLMWRKYKKLAAERIPNVPLKGMLGYLVNRAINLRRLRLPAPRVKPGEEF